MILSNPLPELPQLEDVIDRAPVMVSAETSVSTVIASMSQVWGSLCTLSGVVAGEDGIPPDRSCVLVMDGMQLAGVLTERDVVKLTASEVNLSSLSVAEVMTRELVTLTQLPSQDILAALSLMRRHHIRHLPILDVQGGVVGLVTPSLIRDRLQPIHLLKLRTVADVMTQTVVQAAATTSILSIAQQMTAHQVSCVVIVEPGEHGQRPIGILTERDIVQFQVLELDLIHTPVQTVMSFPLFVLRPGDALWAAQQEMQTRRIRRLVVTDEAGVLQGILTQTSLLKMLDPVELLSVIETLQQQIQEEVQRKRVVESDLRQAYADLEQRITQRTHDLTQANAQLQAEIQQRRQVEQSLQETLRSLEFQKQALDQAAIVAITDRQGIITYVNEQFCRISQYSQEELIGQTHRIINSGYHPPTFFQELWQTIANGKIWKGEIKNKAKDGSYYWVATTIIPFFNEFGKIYQYLAIRFDITDRKQAEAKIREQAELINISSDAILVRDLKHHICFWNQGAERLYGWRQDEVLDRDASELLFTEKSPDVETALATVCTTGEWQGELHKVSKAGQQVTVESRWTLVRDEAGQPSSILSVDTDITEKKLLEAQFLRAQRLESLGTLASGVAHDLNNILTPIVAVSQLLPMRLKEPDVQSQNFLQILQNSARRGTDLVQQILAFGRGAGGQRAVIQVGHLITEIGKVARQTFPKNIELSISLTEEGLWPVAADATQIHQVLMNLFVNARDAMPQGGTLGVKAENLYIDETYARVHIDAHVGSYVVITIADTGIGIPLETIDRIFEPFFTTKALGKGTGLGLSTALGIIRSHGGFLNVYSEVNKGTRFKVYLPAEEVIQSSIPSASEFLQGDGSCILVVDDEASIRDIAKAALENNHYQVMTAGDGVEAITLYAQHTEEIRVILLDVMMPNLDTSTTIRTLQKINPMVKIVLMSGLDANGEVGKSRELGIQAFIAKPFTIQDLLRTLRNIITDTST
jgi:two-component system, cell cycle sensor histidine kinase and response regulator CckA